jgi:hypothetical protein
VRPIHFLHCIDAIDHEVHQNLLQLHAISHNLVKISGQFPEWPQEAIVAVAV